MSRFALNNAHGLTAGRRTTWFVGTPDALSPTGFIDGIKQPQRIDERKSYTAMLSNQSTRSEAPASYRELNCTVRAVSVVRTTPTDTESRQSRRAQAKERAADLPGRPPLPSRRFRPETARLEIFTRRCRIGAARSE